MDKHGPVFLQVARVCFVILSFILWISWWWTKNKIPVYFFGSPRVYCNLVIETGNFLVAKKNEIPFRFIGPLRVYHNLVIETGNHVAAREKEFLGTTCES